MIKASLVSILGAMIVFSVIQQDQRTGLQILSFWIVIGACLWLITKFTVRRNR